MDRLIQTSIQTNIKKSTETIYEIKAPLASFDTVDLDDDEDEDEVSEEKLASEAAKEDETKDERERDATPPAEVQVAEEEESPRGSESTTPVAEEPKSLIEEIESEMATTTKTFFHRGLPTTSDSTDALTDASGTDQGKSEDTTNGSKEDNSSENNASAEDIANKLKVKGRKYKAKASKVKYEQIEDTSDLSDQEKSEDTSPLPTVKPMPQNTESGSDSESSDSETGFVRSGFVHASKDKHVIRQFKPNQQVNLAYQLSEGRDSVDSDHTPQSSPRVRRPVMPPPLSKEESAIISKRKAYEKRLQRLQVTNTPVERPRSTTPISIVGLEEYASISSPERSPHCGKQEKLKITLPHEESCKGKSPRKNSKAGCGNPSVFNFNEDLLFRCTKSAILLQEDGNKGLSPKRILVPPTLSPKLSPANIADFAHMQTSKQPQKFLFSPQTSFDRKDIFLNDTSSSEENWAKFDDAPSMATLTAASDLGVTSSDTCETAAVEKDASDCAGAQNTQCIKDAFIDKKPSFDEDSFNDSRFDIFDKLEDEVITVRIEERNNEKVWDIMLNEPTQRVADDKCDGVDDLGCESESKKGEDLLAEEQFSLC